MPETSLRHAFLSRCLQLLNSTSIENNGDKHSGVDSTRVALLLSQSFERLLTGEANDDFFLEVARTECPVAESSLPYFILSAISTYMWCVAEVDRTTVLLDSDGIVFDQISRTISMIVLHSDRELADLLLRIVACCAEVAKQPSDLVSISKYAQSIYLSKYTH
jgi:hypothetical protein